MAKSEVVEGIPQYARALFLKTPCNAIIPEGNDAWIDARIRSFDRDPGGLALVVVELFAGLFLGVSREEITDLVRAMQYEVPFEPCYQFSDSGV